MDLRDSIRPDGANPRSVAVQRLASTRFHRPEVHSEIARQRARGHLKWGPESIEDRAPGYAGWLPTLGEEYGEVCRALTLEQGDPDRLRAELVDLVATGLMWIDSIDRERRISGSAEQPSPEGVRT